MPKIVPLLGLKVMFLTPNSLVVLANIFALDFDKINHRIMLFTGGFSIFFLWLAYLIDEQWLEINSLIIATLFVIYSLVVMI